jgi:hypothetical protein
VPAGGGSSPSHSGGFGHHALRYYGRSVRCFTGLGQAGAANARETARGLRPGWRSISSRAPATSQEAWPEAELVWWQPTNQSRSGTPTGERAKRMGAQTALVRGARAASADAEVLSASVGVLLPFLFFCSPGERSETRERPTSRIIVPGYRFAHPGYIFCFRAPRPIVMHPAIHCRIALTKVGPTAKFLPCRTHSSDANKKRAARTGVYFRPRDSGGGGPSRAARWWRGRRTQRFACNEGICCGRAASLSTRGASLSTTEFRRCLRPLHHPPLASLAADGPLPRLQVGASRNV